MKKELSEEVVEAVVPEEPIKALEEESQTLLMLIENHITRRKQRSKMVRKRKKAVRNKPTEEVMIGKDKKLTKIPIITSISMLPEQSMNVLMLLLKQKFLQSFQKIKERNNQTKMNSTRK